MAYSKQKSNCLIFYFYIVFYLFNLIQSIYCYLPMDVKFDLKSHEIHRIDTLNILAYTILLIITVVTIWKFKIGHRFRYINETGINILLSCCVGFLIKYVGNHSSEFTYLRVVPSGLILSNNSLKFDNNSNLINLNINQSNALIISTNTKNLTKLIRNLNKTDNILKNKNLGERLNIDYPLNNITDLLKLTNTNKSNSITPSENELKLTTAKIDFNSTLKSTGTQLPIPITESSKENDKKPTLPLNNLKQINSTIKPTLSSNLATNSPKNKTSNTIKDKNFKDKSKDSKKLINKQPIKTKDNLISKLNQTKDNNLIKSAIKSEENDLSKLIKQNKNELTLKLPAPPDSLFVNLDIIDKNISSNKNYVYLFKGELVNQNLQTDLYISQRAQFDPEFFFNIIIPLIVFNAGYNLKRKFFFQNLGAIFTYSFFGTIISMFTIAIVIFGFMILIPTPGFTFIDCLYFSSIISSTDTTIILAFFNNLNMNSNNIRQTLYALVFGESVVSDCVVIVLVRSIDLFEQSVSANLNQNQNLILSILDSGLSFFRIFLLSVLIGVGVGILNALLTKYSKLREAGYLLETSLFVLMSYSAFLISEIFNLSGIISILFVAICESHYSFYNLSPQTQDLTKKLSELLSFLAENFIFSYLGVSMFLNPNLKWSISIIIFSFIAIIVGRILNIYPLSFLLNLSRKNKIPINYQHVLFFSGIRGSLAYALAAQQTITESRQIILSTTSIIVVVTILLGQSLLSTILDVLNINTGEKENDHELEPFSRNNNNIKFNSNQSTNLNKSFTSINANADQSTCINQQNLDDSGWLDRKFTILDCKFLKPLLTNSSPTLIDSFPTIFQPIARFLTTTEQLNAAYSYNYNNNNNNNSGCGFNNVNFTGITTDSEIIEDNQIDRNSYERYSFENSNFEENYLTFGINNDNNRDRLNGQLNQVLERTVDQLTQVVQNNDAGQQIVFDRLAHNQTHNQTKSNKQSKN